MKQFPCPYNQLTSSFSLFLRNAPPLLAASLIHAATCDLLQSDLSDFKKQKVEGEEAGDYETFPCKYIFVSFKSLA